MKGRANKAFSANIYTSPKAGYFILSYSQDKINQTRLSKEGKNERAFYPGSSLLFSTPHSLQQKLIESWKMGNPAPQITRTCSTSACFIRWENGLLVSAAASSVRALLAASWLSAAAWQGWADPYCVAVAFHPRCCHSAAVSGRGQRAVLLSRGVCWGEAVCSLTDEDLKKW